MKLFFFDTETTWLSPYKDRIIQFWAIYWRYDGNNFYEEKRINQYIKIDEDIPQYVSKIHGITKTKLAPYDYIWAYFEEFIQYIDTADYVIGHNVDFDKRMMIWEANRLGFNFNREKVHRFDTMRSTKDIINLPWRKQPKLSELHHFLFKRGFANAHDAMADIIATKDCFLELFKMWEIQLG